jgi:hypothetical protein
MVAKPIWCKCMNHSWTRRQLYAAWERNQPTWCPAPDCQREIPLETIEQLLIQEGLLSKQEDTPTGTDSPG